MVITLFVYKSQVEVHLDGSVLHLVPQKYGWHIAISIAYSIDYGCVYVKQVADITCNATYRK